MRNIRKHTKYKHFKGNDYYVINESLPTTDEHFEQLQKLYGVYLYVHEYTEDGGDIEVLYLPNGSVKHRASVYPEPLVAYIALYGDRNKYVRPRDMFLGKTADGVTRFVAEGEEL